MKAATNFFRLLTLSVVLIGLAAVRPVSAQDITVAEGEIVNDDYFAFGDRILINGTINGDLYAAGNSVEINGNINGDVLAAGNSIIISGPVSQDARIAGNDINITSNLGGNLTVAGSTVDIGNTSSLGGSIVAAAGRLNIDAPVNGNVRAAAGQLRLANNGSINGDLIYSSDQEVNISPEATISGQVVREEAPKFPARIDGQRIGEWFDRAARGFVTFTTVANGITMLIMGLIALALVPRFFSAAAQSIESRTGAVILTGFLVLFLVPLVLLFIMATLIGIPLALIGFLFYGLSIYLASLPVSLWLGRLIAGAAKWQTTPYLEFILGLILLIVLGLIPYIGWFIKLLVIIVGLGALYVGIYRQRQPVSMAGDHA